MNKKTVAEINNFLQETQNSVETFLDNCSEKQRITVLSAVVAQVLSIGFKNSAGKCSCEKAPKDWEVVKKPAKKEKQEKQEKEEKPIVRDEWGFQTKTIPAKINKCLSGKPRTKAFIAQKLDVPLSAINTHFQNLKKCGAILVVEKHGTTGFYKLEKSSDDKIQTQKTDPGDENA